MAIKRNKKQTVSVDFTGVKSGGKIPEGVYPVEVKEVSIESGPSGFDYLKWVFVVNEGDYEGAKLYQNSSLNPDALWSLRYMLECMGEEVPDGKLELDLSEYSGLTCMAEVVHEKYEGKTVSRIAEFLPEDDAPNKKSSKDEEGSNSDWSVEDEKEVFSMDREELEEIIEDEELSIKLTKFSNNKVGLTKLRKATWDAIVDKHELDDDDNDDDSNDGDEEDEDFDVDKANREELVEFVEEEELDIKTSSIKFKGAKGLKALKAAIKDLISDDEDGEEEEEDEGDDAPSEKEVKKAISDVNKVQRDRGGKLQKFVEEFDLDIDLDDYDDTAEKKEAITEALGALL